MKQKIILLVEDDVALSNILSQVIQEKIGCLVEIRHTVQSTLKFLEKIIPNVAIIDFLLHDEPADDILRQLFHRCPSLLITGNLQLIDPKIIVLADDKLEKPFTVEEFIPRVEHLLETVP